MKKGGTLEDILFIDRAHYLTLSKILRVSLYIQNSVEPCSMYHDVHVQIPIAV